MFSVSPAEILTIAVVALLVFGPRRLPEIARRAGKVLRDLREATSELRTSVEAEYREIVEPLRDVRDTMQQAITAADEPDRSAPAGRIEPAAPREGTVDGAGDDSGEPDEPPSPPGTGEPA